MKHRTFLSKLTDGQRLALLTCAALAGVGVLFAGAYYLPLKAPEKIAAQRATPQSPPAARAEQDQDFADAVRAARGQMAPPDAALDRVYAAFNDKPLWFGSRGARARAEHLTRILRDLNAQGLATPIADDALAGLRAKDGGAVLAARDLAVTHEVLRLARAVRLGAATFDDYWKIPDETFDPVEPFIAALQHGDVPAFFTALEPSDPQYRKLIAGQDQYRVIASRGGWMEIPGTEEVKLDGSDGRIDVLRQRLEAEGYAVADLPAAVAQFQIRHGLDGDGRVGKTTLAALNIPVEERLAQISVNLERWRHLPRGFGAEYIAVNTADATLALIRADAPALRLRAITGDKRHPTPVLISAVGAVTFNPPWQVPPSIAGKEILPKLQRDPTYLAANDMVLVDGPLADPQGYYVDWRKYTARSLPFRVKQRPGPGNSLGAVKFEMANPHNIYIHDTPSRTLFSKPERHLSHGCVRVERPKELALEVLSRTPLWDADAIDGAIATGDTRSVGLRPKLPVYVLYWTALVDDDGEMNFRTDAYRRDSAIATALGETRASQAQVATR